MDPAGLAWLVGNDVSDAELQRTFVSVASASRRSLEHGGQSGVLVFDGVTQAIAGGVEVGGQAFDVALGGARANPVTPRTVYRGDLATGAIRDLLATDQPVAQTGPTGPQPEIDVLAWSPDGTSILVRASFDSTCKIQPVSRAIGCNGVLYTLPPDGGQASRLGTMQFASIRFSLWVK